MRGGEMLQIDPLPQARWYCAVLALFFASLALLLLTIVDMRRGFLFPMDAYHKLGSPSTLVYFDPRQLFLLSAGSLGVWMSWRILVKLEDGLKAWSPPYLSRLSSVLALGLM